jgi:hypothetical protein
MTLLKSKDRGGGTFSFISRRSKSGLNLAKGSRDSYEPVGGRSGKTSAENLRMGKVAGAPRPGNANQLICVAGSGIRRRSGTAPTKAMRCHARMALVVSVNARDEKRVNRYPRASVFAF